MFTTKFVFIRKVMGEGGGGEKNQKKIHARENAKKKNSPKEEGKEKKIHAEGRSNAWISHDVTAAMLVSPNNEMAAMLVSRSNPLGIESYYYANVFFRFRWERWLLITWVKPKNCDFSLIII